MKKEDIIELADKQGLVDYFDLHGDSVGQLMLYTLVFDCISAAIKDAPDYKIGYADGVATEREECAQFLESTRLGSLPSDTALHYARLLKSFAEGIRAKGQA